MFPGDYMNDTIVVKFGGSCLSSPENVLLAAKKILGEVQCKKRIIVVVSALAGITDQLLSYTKKSMSDSVSQEDLDEILSMGERTSARIMASSLKSLGMKAVEIDPTSPLWPIFTDSQFGNANIKMTETKAAVKTRIIPLLLEDKIPVIGGFIGLSPERKITTLGRGGSDLTAVVLGNCVDAEEVIFVKDVEGVMSADPKQVSDPQKIESLDIDAAYSLVAAGAKIIQPKALIYKKDTMVLRVVGFDASSLSGGTIITGKLETQLHAKLFSSPLSMITLITHNSSLENVSRILSAVSTVNGEMLGLTVSPTSILLYIYNPSNLVQRLHEMIREEEIAKAIHCVDSLAMIIVSGYGIENIPGVIDTVVSPLSKENVNLNGVFTISSSIRIFVPWNDRKKALSSVNNVLNQFKEM
jgi:aspartate kinase